MWCVCGNSWVSISPVVKFLHIYKYLCNSLDIIEKYINNLIFSILKVLRSG